MTEEQILKALECCIKDEWLCDSSCPGQAIDGDYRNECQVSLLKHSLDLIKRQKAEIAGLKSDLRLKTNDYNHLKEECEKIQKVSSDRKDRLMNTVVNLKNARSEIAKEFEKMLIDKAKNGIIYAMDIPDFVIEFPGDEK